MIIHSPVGRFPFEADNVEIHGGRIRLSGAMGTWPTTVEVPIVELPRIVGGLLPMRKLLPATIGAAAMASAAILQSRRRWRKRKSPQ